MHRLIMDVGEYNTETNERTKTKSLKFIAGVRSGELNIMNQNLCILSFLLTKELSTSKFVETTKCPNENTAKYFAHDARC